MALPWRAGARPRCRPGWLLALACWAGVLASGGSGLAAARTVYVTQQGGVNNSVTLLEALNDPSVDKAVMLEDLYIDSRDWAPYQSSLTNLLKLNRSFTITGGQRDDLVLDLRSQPVGFLINTGVTLLFENMGINGTRSNRQQLTDMGTTIGTDFFFGAAGSVRAVRNLSRIMDSCSSPQETMAGLLKVPRPPGYPGTQRAEVVPGGATFRGEHFPSVVHVIDVVLPPAAPVSTATGHTFTDFPGYTVVLENATWLCPDEFASASNGSTPPVAAIAVPVAVGVALLAALAAGLCWLRRRRRRAAAAAAKQRALEQDLELGQPGARKSDVALHKLLGPDADTWQLVAWRAAGEDERPVGAVPDLGSLELGVLVGAGSFGRVFKGRWRGQQVAVKIIKHEMSLSFRVANEVELMLCLCHPHVVSGLFFATFVNQRRPSFDEDAAGADAMSNGGGGGAAHYDQVTQPLPHAPNGEPALSGGSQQHHRQHQQQRHDTARSRGSGSAASPPDVGSGSASVSSVPTGHSGRPMFVFDASELTRSGEDAAQAAAGAVPAPGTRTGSGSAAGAHSGALPTGSARSLHQLAGHSRRPDAGGGAHSSWLSVFGTHSGHGQCSGDAPTEAQTVLISEFCGAGTLADASRDGKLLTADGRRDVNHMLQLLIDVADGMRYLHSRNVLHGDLKSANVLLQQDASAPHGYSAKITDFGLSRSLTQGETHRSTRTMGTVTHMPPELLRAGKLSAAGDVYAFGIMMWEVMTGARAFTGMHMAEVIERVVLHDYRPPLLPLHDDRGSDGSRGSGGGCGSGGGGGGAGPTDEGLMLLGVPTPNPAGELRAGERSAGAAAAPAHSTDGGSGEQAAAALSHGDVSAGAGGDWPADWVALMSACWDATPAKRPAFEQVLRSLRDMLAARGGTAAAGSPRSAGASSIDAAQQRQEAASRALAVQVAPPHGHWPMRPVPEHAGQPSSSQNGLRPSCSVLTPTRAAPAPLPGGALSDSSAPLPVSPLPRSLSGSGPYSAPLRVSVQLPTPLQVYNNNGHNHPRPGPQAEPNSGAPTRSSTTAAAAVGAPPPTQAAHVTVEDL